MPPYGIALAADAIGKAIGDTFKGMSEGHEERRKEEEAGRRARAAMADEAYQPIRFQQGQLQNQQTAQAIEHAAAQEGRNVKLFPSALKTSEAQADTAVHQAFITGIDAKNAEEKARLNMVTAEENLNLVREQLKEAKAKYPFLVPQLELDQKTKQLAYDEAAKAAKELEYGKAARNEISALLLAAGPNFERVAQVLADPRARYLSANDALLTHLRAMMEMQARAEGKLNPYTAFIQTQGARERSRNNAEQEAKMMLAKIDRLAAAGKGEGAAEMASWLMKYAYSAQLRLAQNPALGIVFHESELSIPPMPAALVDALSRNAGNQSAILGTPAGYETNQNIHTRMNEYVTQGVEWSEAMARARQDYDNSLKGMPTPSDRWVVQMKKAEPGLFEEFWNRFTSSGTALPNKKGPTYETPLPPSVPEKQRADQDAATLRNRRLREIIDSDPETKGATWEVLQRPANKEWKEYIERVYEQKYGSKP